MAMTKNYKAPPGVSLAAQIPALLRPD